MSGDPAAAAAVNTVATAGACCGADRRLTISDYIDAGLRRRRRPPLPWAGVASEDADGRFARFSLDIADATVTDVQFTSSPCVTLVAYCEVAARQITGRPLHSVAHGVCPTALAAELPAVPLARRGCALLASRAVIAAILDATTQDQT